MIGFSEKSQEEKVIKYREYVIENICTIIYQYPHLEDFFLQMKDWIKYSMNVSDIEHCAGELNEVLQILKK